MVNTPQTFGTHDRIDSVTGLGSHLRLAVTTLSQQILEVISRYRSPLPLDAQDRSDEGALHFLALIYRFVKNNEPVRMVLPAFPFKSPNSDTKVLGALPDKAEEIALAHLNGLCDAIKDVYPPGAILAIVSDGLVYNEHAVWTYGHALRQLIKAKGYSNIEFARLKDLLGIPNLSDEMNAMPYAAVAPSIRLALMHRYGNFNWDAGFGESYVNNDENKRLTYCGYLKFLASDLASLYPIGPDRTKSAFKKGVEIIAKSMLKRGEAFAEAVKENYPDHVRLSIHPSTGEDKISVNILPIQKVITPWHSAIAVMVDGTVTAGQRRTFEEDPNMELVYEDGRPSYSLKYLESLKWSVKTASFDQSIIDGMPLVTPHPATAQPCLR